AQQSVNNFTTHVDDWSEAAKGALRYISNSTNDPMRWLSNGEMGGDHLPLINQDQHAGANILNQILTALPLFDEGAVGASVSERISTGASRLPEETAAGAEKPASLPKEGIYEGSDATSPGRTYVGQSGDIPNRITQHQASGKFASGTEINAT